MKLLAMQSVPAAPEPAKHEVKINFNLDAAFFTRFDANKDSALSLVEFQNAMMAQVDDAVSTNAHAKKKFDEAKRTKFCDAMGGPFRSLDVNSDGRLTLSEAPKAKPAAR